MIEIQQISKTFNKGNPDEIKALQNIQLTIPEKEFLVLIGSNGSGKSTLLNAIAGSFITDSGNILLDKQNVTHLADYQRSKWIARIFQNPLSGTSSDLTVLDNFRLAALRTQKKSFGIGINTKFKKTTQEKISLLGMGLENKLEQKMGTLSGGQRQALTLIMAIMDNSKILLMDEPTAALDPKSAKNLLEKAQYIITTFGLTAVFVTHDLRDAFQYGNRLIQMQEGKIVRDLNQQEKSNLQLNDLFGWFI